MFPYTVNFFISKLNIKIYESDLRKSDFILHTMFALNPFQKAIILVSG